MPAVEGAALGGDGEGGEAVVVVSDGGHVGYVIGKHRV